MPESLKLFERGLHSLTGKGCAVDDLGDSQRTAVHAVEDVAQGSPAHVISRPIWKTATATTQATDS